MSLMNEIIRECESASRILRTEKARNDDAWMKASKTLFAASIVRFVHRYVALSSYYDIMTESQSFHLCSHRLRRPFPHMTALSTHESELALQSRQPHNYVLVSRAQRSLACILDSREPVKPRARDTPGTSNTTRA